MPQPSGPPRRDETRDLSQQPCRRSAPFPATPTASVPYPPNRVTPNTRAKMITKVSAVNTARLNQLNQTTGRDG